MHELLNSKRPALLGFSTTILILLAIPIFLTTYSEANEVKLSKNTLTHCAGS